MSRFGFSSSREQLSPYSSMSGGPPTVNDEDYSYITSQDIDDPILDGADGHHHSSHTGGAAPNPNDDVLLVKNNSITYPAHFPEYTIGDGKLRVKDVKDRVGLMMGLSEKGTRRMKLLYKGRQLKEPAAPVRDYGVRNKSQLMAVVPDFDEDSPSDEEMVVVGGADRNKSKSKNRKKKRSSKKTGAGDTDSPSSPRDSNSNADPARSPEPGSGAMKKLDELAIELNTKWLPKCDQFFVSPPADKPKREDEHRKLSESLMQHIMLKLDGVETEGVEEVRLKRREMVHQVQAILKKLDTVKAP